MKFHECDKCGERIEGDSARFALKAQLPHGKEHEFDLCGACAAALQAWSKKKAEKPAGAGSLFQST